MLSIWDKRYRQGEYSDDETPHETMTMKMNENEGGRQKLHRFCFISFRSFVRCGFLFFGKVAPLSSFFLGFLNNLKRFYERALTGNCSYVSG
jgi:hypothetical protein